MKNFLGVLLLFYSLAAYLWATGHLDSHLNGSLISYLEKLSPSGDFALACGLTGVIAILWPRPAYRRIRKITSLKKLENLTWESFEKICRDYYLASGYKVKLVGGSGGDGGIDLQIRKKGVVGIVQCKHWRSRVGVTVIREMFGVMVSEGVDKVVIIGTHGFTKEAHLFARKNQEIELICGQKFMQMINSVNQ